MVSQDDIRQNLQDSSMFRGEVHNKDSMVDSTRFQRSRRLQRILGKLRDNPDEELEAGRLEDKSSEPEVSRADEDQGDRERALREDSKDECNIEGFEDRVDGETRDDSLIELNETRDDDELEREARIREEINNAVVSQIHAGTLALGTTFGLGSFTKQASYSFTQSLLARSVGAAQAAEGMDLRHDDSLESIVPSRSSDSSQSDNTGESATDTEYSEDEIIFASSSGCSSDDAKTNDTEDIPVVSAPRKSRPQFSHRSPGISRSIEDEEESAASVDSTDTSSDGSGSGGSALSASTGSSSANSSVEKMINGTSYGQSGGNGSFSLEPSGFVSNMVQHLNGSFSVPEKVKSHARSQPIAPEQDDDCYSLNDDDDSIVGDQSKPLKDIERPLASFKLATLGRKELMEEVRSRSFRLTDVSQQEATSVQQRTKQILSMNEALLALDTERWDGVSTLASTRGSVGGVEVTLSGYDDNFVPDEIEMNGKFKSQKFGMSGPPPSAGRDGLVEDDGASLAYSLFTEEGRNQDTINGVPSAEDDTDTDCEGGEGDDSSMVPLRHGERESTLELQSPGREQPHEPDRVIRDKTTATLYEKDRLNNLDDLIDQPVEELAAVLSLTDESIDLCPAVKHQPQTAVIDSPGSGNRSWGSDGSSKAGVDHDELRDKIKQFQLRLSGQRQGPFPSGDDSLSTCSSKNIKFLPTPKPAELPKASKKIAQPYVDALAQKQSSKSVSTEHSGDKFADIAATMSDDFTLHLDSKDTMQGSEVGSMTPKSKGRRKKQDIMTLLTKYSGSMSNGSSHGENKAEIDRLVSRIDTVMQRLVQNGKLSLAEQQAADAAMEERSLCASELMRNLAILRSRGSHSVSTGISKSNTGLSTESPMPDIPTTIPVEGLTRLPPKPPAVQQQSSIEQVESKDAPIVPGTGGSVLQQLRARRDQAARMVRERALRLSSWNEGHPAPTESLGARRAYPVPQVSTVRPESRNAKRFGPPRPEDGPSRPGKKADGSSAQVSRTSSRGRSAMPGSIGASSFGTDAWAEFGAPNRLNIGVKQNMASWDQELGAKTNGSTALLEMLKRDSYDSYCDEEDEEEDGSTDAGTVDDSVDEAKRLARIESMILELRERRQQV